MPSIILDPTQKSPERAFALQKYLLLHYQHDVLKKHLNQISTTIPSTPDRHRHSSISSSPGSNDGSRKSSLSSSPGSDDGMSLSSSPTSPPIVRHHHRSGSVSSSRPRRPPMAMRRSSLPTVIDESILGEIEEDELKLKDVNLQIKGTLTDLLNCESVRSDNSYRTWVQTRLMDAERELKVSRTRSCERRRSEDVSGMIMV